MIESGNIVEGKTREKRHMKVLAVSGERVKVEWYDETGLNTANLPVDELDIVAEGETEEYLQAKERSISAHKKNTELNREREERKALRLSRKRTYIGKN